MNGRQKRRSTLLRIALGITAVLVLLALMAAFPNLAGQPELPYALLALAITAFMVNYTIPFTSGDGSLANMVGLTVVLMITPLSMVGVVAAGVVIGDAIRLLWRRSPAYREMPRDEQIGSLAFDVAQEIFTILAALGGFFLFGGQPPLTEISGQSLLALAGYALGFYLSYNLLLLVDVRLRGERLRRYFKANRDRLIILEALPLPLAVYAALLNVKLGFLLYMGLMVMVAGIAVVVHNFGRSRVNAEKRLRELSLLNKVSQALRSNLNLEDLLETIYLQVSTVMGVENFYIALYDADTDIIHFPLAIQHGVFTEWAPRHSAPRLTDHVIRTGAPLLIANDFDEVIEQLGLEPGRNNPESWLGVPLVANNRVAGCLAILSYTPGEAFTLESQNLLTTLAGQAGIAIENADIYGQMQRRAAELSTLTEISATMSSSLDPERVLELVCSSVIRVFNAQKSAIFLLSEDRRTLELARANGLTEAYLSASRSIPVEVASRMAAITTSQPVVVPNVYDTGVPADIVQLARAEGFGSYADLPLQAQGAAIGILAVYFSEPRRFRITEIELLKTFAAQGALAVTNARLFARTDQALARRVEQLQLLEIISRELASQLDPDQLFDLILERAMQFTRASVGSLHLCNNETQTLDVVAARGYPPEQSDLTLHRAGPGSITAQVQQTGQTVLERDLSAEPPYVRPLGETRSQLSVPIKLEEKTLGVITLESPRPGRFDQDDANFVSQLAAQAAVAIDNAQLYRQVQASLREQSLLYESSKAIASMFDIGSILGTVAEKMADAVGATACVISEWSLEADVPILLAEFDTQSASVNGSHELPAVSRYPAAYRRLNNREPVTIRVDDLNGDADEVALMRQLGWGTVLALPLVAAYHVLGHVEVYDARRRDFSEADVRLAATLAGQAAVAIENARLFQRVIEGRDQLAAVLNSTREGVLVIDANSRIALANPRIEEMWGLERDEIVNRSLADLLQRPELDIAEKLGFTTEALTDLLKSLSQGLAYQTSKQIYKLTTSSALRVYERSGTPVLDEKQRMIGWVAVIRDITEEKELEEVRDEVTAMIVHDLRSPMTSVLGALKLIDDLVVPTDQSGILAQAVEVSIRSSKRLLNLVDSLLDLSKLEAGRMHLEQKPLPLAGVAGSVVSDLVQTANMQDVILINETSAELPEVYIDQEKIERVLTNLIDNALKFTPAGGRVTVRGNLTGEVNGEGLRYVLCQVLDTGPGIPDDYRERIFDRFAQVKGRQGRRRGTGLGLTFCKLAVEAHGGRIWVENRPEGGSAFSFTLPVADFVVSS